MGQREGSERQRDGRRRGRRRLAVEALEPRLLLSGTDPSADATELHILPLLAALKHLSESGLATSLDANLSSADPPDDGTTDGPSDSGTKSWPMAPPLLPQALLQPPETDPATGVNVSDSSVSGPSSLWKIEDVAFGDWSEETEPARPDVQHESPLPHEHFESAQPLPPKPEILLMGGIAPGEGPDLYRVAAPAGALTVRIELGSLDQSGVATHRLLVYDADGNQVGEWTFSRPNQAMTIALEAMDPSHAQALYVGVAPDVPGLTGGVDPYELRIREMIAPVDSTPSDWPSPLPGSISIVRTGASATSDVINQGLLATDADHAPLDTSMPGVSNISAVGPSSQDTQGLSPPLQAAAPMGGVLSSGGAVGTVKENEAAWIDLSLIDLEPRDVESISPAGVEGRANTGEAPADLALISGPDGLPLMSATRMEMRSVSIPTSRTSAHRTRTPVISEASLGQLTRLNSQREQQTRRGRVSPRVRASIAAGVCLAAGLAFGLLVPDFSIRLHYEEFRRPRPRIISKTRRHCES